MFWRIFSIEILISLQLMHASIDLQQQNNFLIMKVFFLWKYLKKTIFCVRVAFCECEIFFCVNNRDFFKYNFSVVKKARNWRERKISWKVFFFFFKAPASDDVVLKIPALKFILMPIFFSICEKKIFLWFHFCQVLPMKQIFLL